MFGGIVETIGRITQTTMQGGCRYLTIVPDMHFPDLAVGDSVAVNGVCLTVTQLTDFSFDVTVVPETLRLTNLARLVEKSSVNLERSLKADKRISGHYVQGHVDGTGEILAISHDQGEALLVKISLPAQLAKYVVAKGYIGLDGMSITVIDAMPEWFTVTFIPHTQAVTITQHYTVGTLINIEVDMMGKYIEKLMGAYTYASRN